MSGICIQLGEMKSVTYYSPSLYAKIWDIETPIQSKPAAVKLRKP